jgi:broad specificity phosphatase PhoE
VWPTRRCHRAASARFKRRPGWSGATGLRARATATRLAAALELPVALDADLREYDVGAWSGLTRVEIEAQWPGAISEWRMGQLAATPGGEKGDSFILRVTAALRRAAAARPDQTTLVITHGGVIGALARTLGADPGRVAHLAGRWIDVTPAGLQAGPVVVLLAPETSRNDQPAPSPSGVMDTGAR